MPHYIIERNVGSLSSDQLTAAGRMSNSVLAEMPEVVWVKSYVSDAEGKIYFEYIGPTRKRCSSMRAAAGCPRTRFPKYPSRSIRRCSCSW
ncbi:DUF4242 domain-containing protein [Gemmatimonas sp.]|uniref:DUF4242 domain-containing protein n=2 Tax=Gemmatimonas sp. TaxID=1962908 RepID=UPI0035639C68